MKKGKFLIPALAMLMCLSVSAGVGSLASLDADLVTANANEFGLPELVIGDNTVYVSQDAVAEGMVLTVFTVEEADTYTFISNDFNISVGDMDGNVIGQGSVALDSGTYFILLGTDTLATAGDYVATIIRGVPAPEPTVHEAGQMYAHNNGGNGNKGVYFTMAENDLPFNTDWSVEYTATSVDSIKLTRNGETFNVASTDAGIVVKYGATDYYLKMEGWLNEHFPMQEGDVLTISGTFRARDSQTDYFTIAETTVTYTNGMFTFSTDPVLEEYTATFVANGETVAEITFTEATIDRIVLPAVPAKEGYTGKWDKTLADITLADITFTAVYEETTVDPEDPENPVDPEEPEDPVIDAIEAGQMYKHDSGVNANENEGNGFAFYFKTEAADTLYNSDWSVEYAATSVDNIKLTRNGVTISVAVVGQGTVVKLSEVDHYMKLVPWTTSELLPLQDGDVLTISGIFQCKSDETQRFTITETTITYNGGEIVFSTDVEDPEEPEDPVIDAIEVGQMYAHNNGGNGNQGVYFTMAENDLPFNTDWSVEYTATSVDSIKLTRNGETFNVANVEQGIIVKYGATDYYLKMEGWLNEHFPMQEGDVLTISGTFRARDSQTNYFTIAETSITYEYELYQFSTAEKMEIIEAGYMYAHPYATNTVLGLHFSMNENGATFAEDWSVEYSAITVDAVQLIRGGQTFNVGNMNAGTLVKFSATEYYIKFESWINENFPLQNGDVIVVDGLFKCKASDDIIQISASYIRVEETEAGCVFKFLNPSVTFVNNDGTVLDVKVYAYEAGILVEKPEVDPTATAEGYTCTFLGWYNGETAWNFETDTVVSAVVLQAKYEMVAVEYKATFVVDGETVKEITFTVENMGDIALPTVPEKEGYAGEWDKTLADITLADITFTAVYEEVEEPVNPPSDDNSGSVVPPPADGDEDSSNPSSSDDGEEPTPPASDDEEEKPSILDKIVGVIPQPVKDLVGCKSVVGGVAGGVAALGIAAAALLKKKEDDEE